MKELIMTLKAKILALLFLASLTFSTSVYAQSCTLSPLIAGPEPLTITLDFRPQNLYTYWTYNFQEQQDTEGTGSIKVLHTTNIAFMDFNDAYKRFVLSRLIPKSKCDTLDPQSFKTTVDPKSGMALGMFSLFYEDKICFPLRFFNPPSNPGVTKEAQSYGGDIAGEKIRNAFRPELDNGVILTKMATQYGQNGEKIVNKLAKRPFEGFLQDPDFVQLVHAAINKDNENSEIQDMRFSTNQKGHVQLSITTKKDLTQEAACSLQTEILKSGSWKKM